MKKENQRIRQLLVLLGSGFFFGCLIVGSLVLYYGPSKSYQLKKVLLDPELLPKLSYMDLNPMTGDSEKYVFDSIEMRVPDPLGVKWDREKISPKDYAIFYQMVKESQSLGKVSEEILQKFAKSPVNQLFLIVRTRKNRVGKSPNLQIFQEVQFLDSEDLFRVQLHEDSPHNPSWVYFHHPNLSDLLIKMGQRNNAE